MVMGSPWMGVQPRGALDGVGIWWLVEQTAGVHLPCTVVLPCMQIPVPTLAAVPSTRGEASVAPLDVQSRPSCRAAVAALAGVSAMRGARHGHTERSLA